MTEHDEIEAIVSYPSHLTYAQATAYVALAEALSNFPILMVRGPLDDLPGYGDDLNLLVTNEGQTEGDITIDYLGTITVTFDEWDTIQTALFNSDLPSVSFEGA